MKGDRGDSGRLSISKKQRDLLFERIVRNLARADEILLAVRLGGSDKADHLSHALRDELTFVINDLGWGAQSNDWPKKVSTSPVVVRTVLERLRAEAETLDSTIDLREAAAENRKLIATCDQLLDNLV